MSSALALRRAVRPSARPGAPAQTRGAPVAAAKEVTMPALSSTMTEGKVRGRERGGRGVTGRRPRGRERAQRPEGGASRKRVPVAGCLSPALAHRRPPPGLAH